MAAITEVAKARRQLDQVLGQAGMVIGEALSAARTPAPAVAADSVTPSAPPWLATHTVPPTGIRAWAEPNATLPPIADLAGGIELRLLERLGDWAGVEASNGWTGWVDARLLVPAAP